ncbi:MAG: hypothetical protein ACREVE_14840 [Gammaproteobacteria bacterium]
MRYFKSILLAVMAAFVGVAQGQVDESQLLSATPNLGVVIRATVNFYRNDGTTLLRTGNTGAQGVVEVNVGSYRGPVVVEVLGSDNARYYDEAAGTLVPFPVGSKMYALVPRPGITIAVTPLTDLAYGQAQAEKLFPLSPCDVLTLNEIVRSSLAPGLRSILFVPTRFNSSTTGGSLNNTQGGRYAVVLAALARLGAGKPAPARAVLIALRRDALDGTIDGRIDGGPLVTRPPLYTNLIAELRREIRDVVADYGTAGLPRIVDELVPADRNVDGRGVKEECRPTPPPTGGTGGTGGTGSGGGGI